MQPLAEEVRIAGSTYLGIRVVFLLPVVVVGRGSGGSRCTLLSQDLLVGNLFETDHVEELCRDVGRWSINCLVCCNRALLSDDAAEAEMDGGRAGRRDGGERKVPGPDADERVKVEMTRISRVGSKRARLHLAASEAGAQWPSLSLRLPVVDQELRPPYSSG